MDAPTFIAEFFGPRSKADVCLTSYANDRAESGKYLPVEIFTRDLPTIGEFLKTYDVPGRAVYFCVNTITGNKRSKQNVAEITGLFCDLDFKSIRQGRKEIEAVLARLPLPTTYIVFSGHGLHCYWLLKAGLKASNKLRERVEKALQRLAWLLAGDPHVGEIARVLRLPGSHNSKFGEWAEVEVVHANGSAYKLEQLEAWLQEVPTPLLQSTNTEKKKGNGAIVGESNPFQRLAEQQIIHDPMDVEARLAQMQFQGPDDASVHATQRDVTASLISSGSDPDEIVAYVLAHTKQLGHSWNWRQEERKIRGLCIGWYLKHLDLLPPQAPDWIRNDARLHGFYSDFVDAQVEAKRLLGLYNSEESSAEAPTPPKPGKKEQPPPEIETLFLEDLQQMEVKEREWLVKNFILAGQLNGLFGDGGVGKDYILLQLAIAMTCGSKWLGMEVKQGKVIYCPVEDHIDEVRRREDSISKYYRSQKRYTLRQRELMFMPLMGRDSILAVFDGKSGLVQPVPMWEGFRRVVDEFKPDLVIVGNRVNIFAVQQNEDAHAVQCLRMLNSLCVDFGTAVIMPGHVSLRGKQSGDGTSGSVQWSNGVRMRTFLRRPKEEEEDNKTINRELEVMKANWGPTGDVVSMQWSDHGLYVVDPVKVVKPEPIAGESESDRDKRVENDRKHRVEIEFMRLLDTHMAMKINVSMDATAKNNAPTLFSRDPSSRYQGVKGRKDFMHAMHRLFDAQRIVSEEFGPPSKRRSRIAKVGLRVVK